MRVHIALRGNLISEAFLALVEDTVEVPDTVEDADIVLCSDANATWPDVKILLLTDDKDIDAINALKEGKITGLISRQATGDELRNALRAIGQGDIYIHPVFTRELLQKVQEPRPAVAPDEPTPREIDVLRLIAQGCTNRQAAEKLRISTRTVESHRANLMQKLRPKGYEGRVGLIRYAREEGLI